MLSSQVAVLQYILVILQVADALALLPGPSLGLAPSGPAQALFKTTTRFVLQLELFRVCILSIYLIDDGPPRFFGCA
ncbi:hypothetical protein C3432_17605 [Citrobacter amalonaticus]|uniref:Uncharacterized protein n=1 Tax=Citrobacter amalonaticus TaxID=35703 RepID=A0A2S4RTT3_CITAM|nr:hypothetical protein C3432_17605 [Citrobacter amalonaticus]POT72538.1 hypothetical protein C3436_20280 [Citrobacter amalonaticus]POU63393.1 hypothetical protein C3430_18535 [Citrobacter amalonaticus]POV03157.1 hypothetical protein C3424_21450 [Citrobacter amalonaticus]